MNNHKYPATHNILKAKWLCVFEDKQQEEVEEVDVNAALLEDGHTYQTEESNLEEKLNLNPNYCQHRMVSNTELAQERNPSLYEQFCPSEPGPWSFVLELDNGTDINLGYEGLADTSDMMEDRWVSEYLGFTNEQSNLAQIERTVGRQLIKWRVEHRERIFQNILNWVNSQPVHTVRASKSRFWRWVLASRAACAKYNNWTEVCLTKAQVTTVFAAYDSRLK